MLRETSTLEDVPSRPTRQVLLGQAVLFLGAAIAVALHPGFVLKRDEGGFSNYGIHIVTVVPYSMSFIGAACGSIGAYRLIDASTRSALRTILLCYAILCIAVLASTYPYKVNRTFDDIHVGVGIVAMLFQLISSFALFAMLGRRSWALLVQIAGFAIGALTFFSVVHWIFLSQVLSGFGFGVLLVRTVSSRCVQR